MHVDRKLVHAERANKQKTQKKPEGDPKFKQNVKEAWKRLDAAPAKTAEWKTAYAKWNKAKKDYEASKKDGDRKVVSTKTENNGKRIVETTKDGGQFRITESTMLYKGDKNAKWVRVEYRGSDGKTKISGVALDAHGGSKEKALKAAKENIESDIKKEAPSKKKEGKKAEKKESETPLKDAYEKRMDSLDETKKYTDTSKLQTGDYVHIPEIKGVRGGSTGFVKKIGRKNITIESPYGGWGGQDLIQIMDLQFSKEDVGQFVKPKKESQVTGEKKEGGKIKELANKLADSQKTGKELGDDFFSELKKLSPSDQQKVMSDTPSRQKKETLKQQVKEATSTGMTVDRNFNAMSEKERSQAIKDFKQSKEGKDFAGKKSINVKDKVDHYKTLSREKKEKYRNEILDHFMDVSSKAEDPKTSEAAKNIYKHEMKAADKLMTEIRKVPELQTHELPEKEFRESKWKFGGTMGQQIDMWTGQAKEAIGQGKLFGTKEEAIKDINQQIKTSKLIEDNDRVRLLESVIKKLKK